MSDNRLSSDAQDKLAQQLRENLSRRRRRPLSWTLVSLALVALMLTGIWYMSRPTHPMLPPLMLTCFDGLDGDHMAAAQLVAPSDPDANLEGLEIQWRVLWKNKVEEAATTKVDRFGKAQLPIKSAPLAQIGVDDAMQQPKELRVSFVDPAGRYRRDCQAFLFACTQPRVVAMAYLVPDDPPIQWTTTAIDDLPDPQQVPKRKPGPDTAIFAAGLVDAATYRAMRAWLHYHQSRPVDPLPPGPLLRERAQDLAKRLHLDWGE